MAGLGSSLSNATTDGRRLTIPTLARGLRVVLGAARLERRQHSLMERPSSSMTTRIMAVTRDQIAN